LGRPWPKAKAKSQLKKKSGKRIPLQGDKLRFGLQAELNLSLKCPVLVFQTQTYRYLSFYHDIYQKASFIYHFFIKVDNGGKRPVE
jgi:hypothetical protein